MDFTKYAVTKAMLQMGFSPAYNGFYFLRDAVLTAHKDPDTLTLITKLIYAPIAKNYGTTSENIEKSIRKAAEVVWKTNGGRDQPAAVLKHIYYYPETKPENKELISLICSFVKESGEVFNTDVRDGI